MTTTDPEGYDAHKTLAAEFPEAHKWDVDAEIVITDPADAALVEGEDENRHITDADMRIEEIRERWEKATPGPWKAAEQTHGEWVGIHDNYSALGNVVGPSDADAIAHAREDVPWLLAEMQRLNHGRLCRRHYENGPDDEVRAPFGCIICVLNRAMKAEGERDQARKALDALIPENNNNFQGRCKAEGHARKLEEAVRQAVMLANDAIARTREGNRRLETETGRPSTMRPFVFVDELIAAMRPGIPDAEQRTRDLFLAAALEDGPADGEGDASAV